MLRSSVEVEIKGPLRDSDRIQQSHVTDHLSASALKNEASGETRLCTGNMATGA